MPRHREARARKRCPQHAPARAPARAQRQRLRPGEAAKERASGFRSEQRKRCFASPAGGARLQRLALRRPRPARLAAQQAAVGARVSAGATARAAAAARRLALRTVPQARPGCAAAATGRHPAARSALAPETRAGPQRLEAQQGTPSQFCAARAADASRRAPRRPALRRAARHAHRGGRCGCVAAREGLTQRPPFDAPNARQMAAMMQFMAPVARLTPALRAPAAKKSLAARCAPPWLAVCRCTAACASACFAPPQPRGAWRAWLRRALAGAASAPAAALRRQPAPSGSHFACLARR